MLSKFIFSFVVCALPMMAIAGNGYWQEIQVCDYESVVTETPKTHCTYAGVVNAEFPSLVANDQQVQTTIFQNILDNHVNCPSYVHKVLAKWVPLANGLDGWADYQGNVPLHSQVHKVESTTQTILIPGSCRTEWVWIPLCDDCVIP